MVGKTANTAGGSRRAVVRYQAMPVLLATVAPLDGGASLKRAIKPCYLTGGTTITKDKSKNKYKTADMQ